MAVGDSYATPQDYRLAKGGQSSGDDTALLWQLAGMSRVLDLRLNQPYGFNLDATVTTRTYRKNDQIAPIASTTGLIVKASSLTAPIDWPSATTLVLDTDFELLPLNPRTGWPWTGISLLSGGTPSVINPASYWGDDYRLQVTALHGWPDGVPAGIKWGLIELVAIVRVESSFATNTVQELDQVVGASTQARSILKSLYESYNEYPVAIA